MSSPLLTALNQVTSVTLKEVQIQTEGTHKTALLCTVKHENGNERSLTDEKMTTLDMFYLICYLPKEKAPLRDASKDAYYLYEGIDPLIDNQSEPLGFEGMLPLIKSTKANEILKKCFKELF